MRGIAAPSCRLLFAGLKHAYDRSATRILRVGRARNTRYALRQALPGLKTAELPVFRVDEAGQITSDGKLVTLAASEAVWLPRDEIIDGLPPEMHDIAPRGFLGRSFAKRHSELDLPEDVSQWSDNHVLIAISRRGEDLPGNLVVGSESFDRYQALTYAEQNTNNFRVLSAAALAGEHVGSSAGGEQPKFTALLDGEHCLVKFASNESDNSRRWQDLLQLEHLALATLRDAGIAAAETKVYDGQDLRCLIVNRFDRIGARGRRAVITLSAAIGRAGGTWTDAALELHRQGQLSGEDMQRVAVLDAFGASIANTDRHLHNILLYPTSGGYEVAPAFDQLPMAYSPPASGHLKNTAVNAAVPRANTLEVWDTAQELASEFWRRACEQELSPAMQQIAATHLDR